MELPQRLQELETNTRYRRERVACFLFFLVSLNKKRTTREANTKRSFEVAIDFCSFWTFSATAWTSSKPELSMALHSFTRALVSVFATAKMAMSPGDNKRHMPSSTVERSAVKFVKTHIHFKRAMGSPSKWALSPRACQNFPGICLVKFSSPRFLDKNTSSFKNWPAVPPLQFTTNAVSSRKMSKQGGLVLATNCETKFQSGAPLLAAADLTDTSWICDNTSNTDLRELTVPPAFLASMIISQIAG